MTMLDVFHTDLYDVVSLTTAINKLPYVPQRIGELGIFQERGITTLTAVIEERYGKIQILGTAARGTQPQVGSGVQRTARAFAIPHIPVNEAVYADDVQNVRAFGSESDVEVVAGKVNEKMSMMRTNIELTHEWHRIGAIKGVVYDSDGTTVIYNWFDEFGITQQFYDIDFSGAPSGSGITNPTESQFVPSVKITAGNVKRYLQDTLGATPFKGMRAFCGSDFYNSLTTCMEVRKAFDRWQESQFLRDQQARMVGGFEYAGIIWEEYRGHVGTHYFVEPSCAYLVPEGVPDLFQCIYAPANFIETVNTVGKPVYAKQEVMKFGIGIELHSQSNPLMICARPAALVKLVDIQAGST